MAKMTVIRNFRQAAALGNVFRCASTDVLGEKLDSSEPLSGHDRFVFEQAGLILDLRSPSERKERQAKKWMQLANMQLFETSEAYTVTNNQRCVVRVDVLSPPKLMEYIEANWLSGPEKAQAVWFKVVDGGKLHELRIEAFNERGLAGLNEAILETGKAELFRALATITTHLEANPDHPVVVHCVQGKDRTGMIIMLLQSLMGASDEAIVADYFLSNAMLQKNVGSAAVDAVVRKRGRLDRKFFSGTNEQAMITTLAFLRNKYGSISPGYLGSIGFDQTWRSRLLAVLQSAPQSRL